ncbi:MAG TPA: hypothetical protein VFP84_00205 [Kofleriaceae bacterium]|nr:hypothetical protein [Kofleriaceae bacterium]
MRASRHSSELRVPTKAVAVRLALVGGLPTPAELFVTDVPRRGHGQLLDDLAALVLAPKTFLPVKWSNRVRLLGKHAIAWIAIGHEPTDDVTLYDREHIVELELLRGTKLLGNLLDSAPLDRTRVIDHLNGAGAFVRLWTADAHYLVNTQQIVAVTELGGEAR